MRAPLPISLLTLLSVTIFAVIAALALLNGHPNEDAYILHIYAEHLAQDGVINYVKGGPPAEGATDFLWMIALSSLSWLGLPAAWGGVIFNTLGLGILTYLLLGEALRQQARWPLVIAITLFLPLYSISQASVGGFSTNFYAGLVAVLFLVILRLPSRHLVWVPLISILIGLVRPDGVIIGVTATLATLVLVDRADRGRYALAMLAATLIGLGYFYWRYSYFGQTLPLPLYVKSAADHGLAGLGANARWLLVNIFLVFLTLRLVIKDPAIRLRFGLAALGPLTLYATLFFAVQSQNLAMRFQAPLSVVVLFGATIFLSRYSQKSGRSVTVIMLLLALIHFGFHGKRTTREYEKLVLPAYDDTFAYFLNPVVPAEARIALTEAGNFAYWLQRETVDLVGLNTAHTAREGASPAYIADYDPDLVFWHLGKLPKPSCPDGQGFCTLSQDNFEQQFLTEDIPSYDSVQNRVARATLAIHAFLGEHPASYDLYVVRQNGRFQHMYARKRGGVIDKDAFEAALTHALDPAHYLSFTEMSRQHR